MVTLTEKSDAALEQWMVATWASYRESLLAAGFTPAAAEANIERNQAALLVDGRPNSDQCVFDVIHDGHVVGTLWLARQTEGAQGAEWFIYDIVIDEQRRGQGLGRATMLAAEDYAKSHGASSLGLNVFGYNTVARDLYGSLGYVVQSQHMTKAL
jgi:GNAT superfamily N-acetyltransferase